MIVDLLAFLVAGPFKAAGAVAFENPSDPFNVVYFFSVMLILLITYKVVNTVKENIMADMIDMMVKFLFNLFLS